MLLGLSLLSLLALYGVLFLLAERRTAEIERTYPPLGTILTHRGSRFHIYERGQGPDVVLIHGASGNMRDMINTLVDGLSSSFRVIVIDRPGLGYSDPLPNGAYRIADQAEFIRSALANYGVTRPIVLGHSLGGAVSLAWATQAPETVRALVLLSAVTTPWIKYHNVYAWWHALPVIGHMSALIVNIIAYDTIIQGNIDGTFAPNSAPKTFRQDMGVDLVLRWRSIVANARHRKYLVQQVTELSRQYSTLKMPIHAVSGDVDTAVPHQLHITGIKNAAPHAQIHMLQGLGHMPHYFAADKVVKTVAQAHQDAMLAENAGKAHAKTI
jgi:pimeloyl-ACP methyl ester carboxylesterase